MASRNQNVMENPCKKHLQWKSFKNEDEKITGAGFQYWVKGEGDEKGKNVNVELPFNFALITDDGVTFKGYNEKSKQGVWSNEVVKKEHEVKIKDARGTLMTFKLGDYKDKKADVEMLGAKYTKSVYIGVLNDKKEWELWNLQLNGAALSGAIDRESPSEEEANHGWFAFTKTAKSKLFSNILNVNDFQLKKKGATKFTVPVFGTGAVLSEEDIVALNALTSELTAYHKWYFAKPDETEEV